MGVWNKIFGNAGGVRPAGLDDAIKRPAARRSWESIAKVASDNTKLYNDAFNFIPANGRSIWPAKYELNGKEKSGLMPFDKAFWSAPRHEASASNLKNVNGYITLLPWLWTQGENNNSGYHSALFANKTLQPSRTGDDEAESVPVRV